MLLQLLLTAVSRSSHHAHLPVSLKAARISARHHPISSSDVFTDHDEYCTQSQNENVVLQPGGAGGAQESHLGTMDLGTAPQIGLELWIKGASQHGNTAIPPDESVIATDAPNGGVDIFLAKYGDLSAKKDANESPLVTLRP